MHDAQHPQQNMDICWQASCCSDFALTQTAAKTTGSDAHANVLLLLVVSLLVLLYRYNRVLLRGCVPVLVYRHCSLRLPYCRHSKGIRLQ
jgi:hypothetical protein